MEALGKAATLVKGKKIQGCALNFGLVLGAVIVHVLTRDSDDTSVSRQLFNGIIMIHFNFMVLVLLYLKSTVLYFQCKKSHGEEIELQGDWEYNKVVFVISFFFLFLGIMALAVLHLLLPNSRPRRLAASACDRRISPEELQKYMPEFIYTAESDLEECAVCLEGYQEGETCSRLPGCCHVYHSRCLHRWLVKVPNCPVCRTFVRLETSGRGPA